MDFRSHVPTTALCLYAMQATVCEHPDDSFAFMAQQLLAKAELLLARGARQLSEAAAEVPAEAAQRMPDSSRSCSGSEDLDLR